MTTEQKFNCIFCKDVFDNKEELQVHFRKHADPQFKSNFQYGPASLVSKKCDNKKTEMVSCDVCSQQFATISKAITHKHKVHPDHDVKYFCPWCGKLFTMKHPYNVHLQNAHKKDVQTDDKTFHCDCCDVDFFLTSAMMYHNKFFHRQDSDLPDIGTSKKMKLYQNQDIIQIYYCPFCGEEYENKVNLFKHVSDDHSDENQSPDEVLRCSLCEAIFYHLDAYEIHLSFHTIDDLYRGTNDLMSQVTDFSLETVPPIVEPVEREDQDMGEALDPDVESSVNAMGIENFLELAMGASEDSNSTRPKKKKHKKSKKPPITLNEFLSMNQDVFGEDLDFHGAEEVPTQVVAKQFKNKKKSTNLAASAELEKLKSKGIVVMKVGASKSIKHLPKKVSKKGLPKVELKTSNELLTKLINQSNKQIKIVKKSVPNITTDESEQDTKNKVNEAPNTSEGTITKSAEELTESMNANRRDEEMCSDTTKLTSPSDSYKIPLPYIEECSSTTNIDTNMDNYNSSKLTHNGEDNDDDMNITSTNTSNVNDYSEEYSDDDDMQKHEQSLGSNINGAVRQVESKYEENHENSASESNNKEKHIDSSNNEDGDEDINNIPSTNNINSAPLNVRSLSTLKHLSHITVKPLNQNKITSEHTSNDAPQTNNEKTPLNTDTEPSASLTTSSLTGKQQSNNLKTKSLRKDSTLDALKILSKNITVKSLTSTQKHTSESGSDDESETHKVLEKPSSTIKLKDISINENVSKQKLECEKPEPVSGNKVPNLLSTPIKLPFSFKKCETTLKSTDQSSAVDTNADILKHLPNLVTKSVTPTKNVQPRVMELNQLSVKTVEPNNKEQEVIEISDLDDSDDEIDANLKQPDIKQDSRVDPLKNISKHITVKSLNHSAVPVKKNIKVEQEDYNDDVNDDGDAFDSDDAGPSTQPKACAQKISSKNEAFQNVLKNLGKNITIKSPNSLPSPIAKPQENNSEEDTGAYDDEEFDSDTEIGKVKITEIEDHHSGDETYNSDNCDEEMNDNTPVIESPHDSCDEQNEEDDKEFDFESQIKCTKVEKNSQEVSTNKNTMCLNNLMNISKNITIKSVNSKPIDKQDQPSTEQDRTSKQTPKKLTKPPVKEAINEKITYRNNKKTDLAVDHTTNDALDQKVSVNKEVTVKTFQTKTVIQEITTTVTKTIKTVNQTVKQETRNTGQVSIPVLPQKVQGMRPSTSKNLQGVVIRHATPIAKTSNTVSQIRPSGPVVRPSKQIVPMRPGLNTRPRTPRMPTVRPNLPTPSQNKQVIGRPLKFSPSAITSTIVKRPHTDESSGGPFSCFKKPKESLIPVSDLPTFSGEDSVQIKAASHTSSNYMSTSKVVKGNSVMTATQMKSETTSMQQVSRTNKVSGIKVKSAQTKQQVQEKSESTTMKNPTLQAIEKLQKQGLLIKKPRIEENENSSNNDEDDNLGYSSADEHFE